ncbi:MAG: hypothetical protein B0D92_08385 [Spirochaeta sp. LUC14_002_19_P3]|nr:MAG: hypothetical protein B0D92_08385 [Spirochaeta sp. LUC14_002_19_P3]
MIVSCGEALIDFVPKKTGPLGYTPCPGGSPFNLAIAVARLGTPAGFISKISTDLFGDMLFNRLASEGVDTRFTLRSDRPSTLAFVKIEAGQEPRYAFYTENTADRSLSVSDISSPLPNEVKCLEFGSISLLLNPQGDTIKSLIRRESGKRVISFDPNVRPMLIPDKAAYTREMEQLAALADIIKVSGADLEWMYPQRPVVKSAEDWLARGAKAVVVTRGKDGAMLLASDFRVEVPEYFVTVKDTIGAGDTFHAAFLSRLFQNDLLTPEALAHLQKDAAQDAVSYAVKASSLNCARQGADPPTAEEMAAAK